MSGARRAAGPGPGPTSSDEVVVWYFRTDEADTDVDGLVAVLDDEERGRADAMRHPTDRRDFVVAHGVSRLILGRQLDLPPAGVRWRPDRSGRPELTGTGGRVQVSLSHSDRLAALALTGYRRVGVDVQRLATGDPTGLAARFFPAAEAGLVAGQSRADRRSAVFTRLWARKEACVKVTGSPLVEGLALPVRGRAGALVGHPAGPVAVRDVPAPDGFRAAVALNGASRFRVTSRRWCG
ncbi:4'-phosphopantetheinyl transferase family protein [Micromonospora echinospora]|uniref:4'-phosphopantetheinyl transferase family protein n=1 Tax=Micromonospora echinospora TaxID=1877 RepID=UPI0037A09D57